MSRVLLVLPTATYRASDFLDAARSVGAEVVVASEETQALAPAMRDRFVKVDLCDPAGAADEIVARASPLDAAVGVDEQGVLVAAHVAARLGLPHNPPDAVAITRDKRKLRETLTAAGMDQPAVGEDAAFPCVVKATTLSGSRGVIRANDEAELASAIDRVRAIAASNDSPEVSEPLVESYVPGAEVAVEGLLVGGVLNVLAIFDKPDPLEGPYFEETIYVTPSRSSTGMQRAIEATVSRACTAIGLVEGPVHAEVRLSDDGPVLLEVAARSIGGLCSRTLRFGAGISLEELILRHALDLELGDLARSTAASGVMMIPIPRSGILEAVGGVEQARAVEGVVGIEVTVPVGQRIVAQPEGDRYLGFIFATGPDPQTVEDTLRKGFSALRLDIGSEQQG